MVGGNNKGSHERYGIWATEWSSSARAWVDCPIRHLARDRGSSYWPVRGRLNSGRELAWWQCRGRDRLDLRAGGHRAEAENCVSLRARPLFTSPAGGEPVACLFDSVSRQKTYETGSWSGHETGQVWARLQCTHVWLTRVRTERGCARLG